MYERQITHVENEVHPCDKAVSPWEEITLSPYGNSLLT